MIDFIGHIMEEYLVVSRAFAMRMAMQGGLKVFAAGLKCDVTLDKYVRQWRSTSRLSCR